MNKQPRTAALAFSLLVLLLALLPEARVATADTVITDNITQDTTWDLAGSPYIIQNDIRILSGVTLTIEPGVQVRFSPGLTYLQVWGTLVAQGTAQQPIQFGSDAATPAAGDWGMIAFDPGSSGVLDYCTLSHGGRDVGYGANSALVYIATSGVDMRRCRVEHSATNGINLQGRGVNSMLLEGGIQPTIADTEILDAGAFPLRQTTISMRPNYENLTFSPGITNVLAVRTSVGDLGEIDVTLDGSAAALNGGAILLQDSVQVLNGHTLTLKPGTTLHMQGGQGTNLRVYAGSALVAEGTPAERITITSDAAAPVAGSWGNVFFDVGSTGRLAYCDLSGGGTPVANSYGENLLMIKSGDVSVRYCHIHTSPDGMALANVPGANFGETGPRIEHTTVSGTTHHAIYELNFSSHPRYLDVTLTGNVADSVYIVSGASYGSPDAYVFDGRLLNGAPLVMESGIQLWNGDVMTMTAGTTLEMQQGLIEVYDGAGLYLEGTPEEPATIRAHAADPDARTWEGIYLQQTARGRLSYCDLSGAGRTDTGAVFYVGNSTVPLTGCRLHNNSVGVAASNSVPLLRYNQFAGNDLAVKNNHPTGVIDGRFNWWGDATGPQHPTLNPAGQGDPVTDGVLFTPWLSAGPDAVTFDPASAGNAGQTTVRFYNVPDSAAMQIVLQRPGRPDVAGAYRGPSNDGGVDYTFMLDGASPGSGAFVAAGLPEAPAIPGTFSVVAAPPDAQEAADNNVTVEINGPANVRRIHPFPVTVYFGNSGLIDSSPTAFRLTTLAGVEILPAADSSYLVSDINRDVAPGDPTVPRHMASFIRPALRPGVSDYVVITMQTDQLGPVPMELEVMTSSRWGDVFTIPVDLTLHLDSTIDSLTATRLEATHTLASDSFSGTITETFEILGGSGAFTPTLEIADDGTNLTYTMTAAIPSPMPLATLVRGVQVDELASVQRVFQLTREAATRLRDFTAFNEGDRVRAQRLVHLGCLLSSPYFDPNNLSHQQAADLLARIGDFEDVALKLNNVRRAGLLSVDMSLSLTRLDSVINGLYEETALESYYRDHDGYENVPEEERLARAREECHGKTPVIRNLLSTAISAYDPNDKFGPAGVGVAHNILNGTPLFYVIGFENVVTATAPAQVVAISDVLDDGTLDPSSVRLEGFTIGGRQFPAGNAALPYWADLDMRAERGVFVRVEAALSDGVLTWTLTSLDPATMALPTDPLAGFLPPNQDGTEGQGYVSFTVLPDASLPPGTVIRNGATIVFDDNAPIATPTWSNTIWSGLAYQMYQPFIVR